jgi:hypothetical protein
MIRHYSDRGENVPADAFGITLMDAEDLVSIREESSLPENAETIAYEGSGINRALATAMRDRAVGAASSWLGKDVASWDDAYALLNQGWEEGAHKTTDLAIELDGKVRAHEGFRRRVHRSDVGDELCADRAIRGEWDTAWSSMVRKRVAGASNIVTLGCAFGANAHIDAESMFWCGAQMIVIADFLENAGYQTEIIGLANTRHGKPGGMEKHGHKSVYCNYLSAVYAKRAGEPLRVDLLASVFANAGLFRTLCFEMFLRSRCFVGCGIGSSDCSVGALTLATKKAADAGMLPEIDVIVGSAYDRDTAVKNIVATINAVTREEAVA